MADKGPRLLDGLTSTMTYEQMRRYADTLNVTICSALLPAGMTGFYHETTRIILIDRPLIYRQNAAFSSTTSSPAARQCHQKRCIRPALGTPDATRNRAEARQPTRIPDSGSHVRRQSLPDYLRPRRHPPNFPGPPAHTRFKLHALQSTELVQQAQLP